MRRNTLTILLLAVAALALPAPSHAQCMLANPSFELPGSGTVFAGWNEFGNFGSTSTATHGSTAARVTGPNTGTWAVSAFWQRLDTVPGDQWTAEVCVSHSSAAPLTGGSRAILNIEWRDAAGDLISYESFTVADATTPTDEPALVSVTSGPAPAGAVATHVLLGVLQGPTDPTPDVIYDEAVFEPITPPDQWADFPGGRTLDFSGHTWRVKGPGFYGPGPNLFSDDPAATWVDANGRLHLTVRNVAGSWYSTELVPLDPLGYGDYVFTTVGDLDALDPNVIFGLFLWEYGPCWNPAYGWWNPYNEIDIEFSRWGDPGADIGQFVAQPYDYPGNLARFDAAFSPGELTSHAFRWLPDRVEFRSWRGGPQDEGPGTLIASWTYTGPHISRPVRPRVHLNFWYINGGPATDQEVVLDAFTFEEECVPPHCTQTVSTPETPVVPVPTRVYPNPFATRTSLIYTMDRPGTATLEVHDVTGRLVRTLVDGLEPAGEHAVVWNGRNETGARVAAGVYHYRLRTAERLERGRMILVR